MSRHHYIPTPNSNSPQYCNTTAQRSPLFSSSNITFDHFSFSSPSFFLFLCLYFLQHFQLPLQEFIFSPLPIIIFCMPLSPYDSLSMSTSKSVTLLDETDFSWGSKLFPREAQVKFLRSDSSGNTRLLVLTMRIK